MKATGNTTKLMDKAVSFMLMVTVTRENGSMIKLMEMGCIIIKMELSIWVNGTKINNMATA